MDFEYEKIEAFLLSKNICPKVLHYATEKAGYPLEYDTIKQYPMKLFGNGVSFELEAFIVEGILQKKNQKHKL